LDSETIFEWLVALKVLLGDAVFIGYGFTFDSTHALVSLQRDKLRRLHLTGMVYWKGWRIEMVPRKWLRLAKIDRHTNKTLKGQSIQIQDSLGFFGGQFDKVVSKWKPYFDPALVGDLERDLVIMAKGKAMRAEAFTSKDLPFLEVYNGAEVVWLSRLMAVFYKAAADSGIKLTSFYGAGAAASTLLKQNEIAATQTVPEEFVAALRKSAATLTAEAAKSAEMAPRLLAKVDALRKQMLRTTHPDAVERAAEGAFFGGRSELTTYGVIRETIRVHDVSSQYPSIERRLPNLTRGHWERGHPFETCQPWAFYRVEWNLPRDRNLYPFAWRDSDGSVYFPPMGRSWTTADELRAALEVGDFPAESIRVLDSWTFVEDDPLDRPWAFLNGIAAKRLQHKRDGHPAQYPEKVSMNSCFGKTIQGQTAKHLARPSFYSVQEASWITGGGRAMLYRAARSGITPEERLAAERRVVLMATDSLMVTGPWLPLDFGEGLGQWTKEEHAGGLFAQAGVYCWLDADFHVLLMDEKQPPRARGYLDREFPWEVVWARWAAGSGEPVAAKGRPRFFGLGAAVSTGRWDLFLRFVQMTRNVMVRAGDSGETKRFDAVPSARWTPAANPSVMPPMRTFAWDPCSAMFGAPVDSKPYNPLKEAPSTEEMDGDIDDLSKRDAKHGWGPTGPKMDPSDRGLVSLTTLPMPLPNKP